MKQTTLKTEVRCAGIGLHGGKRVELIMKPAPADTGVLFILGGQRIVPLEPCNVVATGLATTLGTKDARVSTVEHLLAALVGLEIDNVLVEVRGEEIPILDGSAAAFVYLFQSVGIRVQEQARRVAKVKRPVVFAHEGKQIVATPFNGLKIDYQISFSHPHIGCQEFSYESSPRSFVSKIARARTFGFMKDVEMMQKNGLALGGSLDNAVVFDDYGVVNPDGLRFSDEMVRHKILDFMGDIGVSRHRLWGHFAVSCSGHEFNNRFMRFLYENEAEYLETAELGRPARSAAREIPVLAGAVPAWA